MMQKNEEKKDSKYVALTRGCLLEYHSIVPAQNAYSIEPALRSTDKLHYINSLF